VVITLVELTGVVITLLKQLLNYIILWQQDKTRKQKKF